VFDHVDHWYPGSELEKDEFFNVKLYNSDTVEIDEYNEDYYHIATLYIRL